MKLSQTPLRLTSFWPLLVLILGCGWLVWYSAPVTLNPDAVRWANLRVVPLKLLLLFVAIYVSHRYDERAFASLSRRIEALLRQAHAIAIGERNRTDVTSDSLSAVGIMLLALAITAIARAIVYGATVIALCTGG